MKKLLLVISCCLVYFVSLAQSGTDTLRPRQDSPVVKQQDTGKIAKPDSTRLRDTTVKKTPIIPDTTTGLISPPPDSPTHITRIPVVAKTHTMPAELNIEGSLLPGYKHDSLPYIARMQLFQAVLRSHPYFNFFGKPIAVKVLEKKVNGREGMFYFLVVLLIYFGFIRLLFGRYIDNIITLFFRVSMRQQQIRDQLLQSPLPSLFLNLLYFINGGFFLALVLKH